MCTGVTDFKVTSSGDLAGTYKKGAAPGCQTAACGRYANQVHPAFQDVLLSYGCVCATIVACTSTS